MSEDIVLKVINALSSAQNWAVLSHVKPDGDTLGCAAAIASLGIRLGKDVIFCCADEVPERYSFLIKGLPFRQISSISRLPESFLGEGAAIVCLDTSSLNRSINGIDQLTDRRSVLINIDHHIDNAKYGDIDFIIPTSSSTCEVVMQIFRMFKHGMTKEEATALYTALITDNGRFSYASTTAESHRCAIELLDAGALPNEITDALDSTLTQNTLLLWSVALSRIELFCDESAATTWLTNEDFVRTCTTRSDTDGLVNYMLRIKTVGICALITETDEGAKVSLRSRGSYSAHAVASVFGGGGHLLASGCTLRHPIKTAHDMIRQEMKKHVDSLHD